MAERVTPLSSSSSSCQLCMRSCFHFFLAQSYMHVGPLFCHEKAIRGAHAERWRRP